MSFRIAKNLSLLLIIVLVLLSGCIRPNDKLTRGLTDVNDQIIFATAAPDSIMIYSVAKAQVEHSMPADERLNDMVVDKAGKFAYVVTKNGWLNKFNLQRGDRVARVRVGTILQSVALSADQKYLAIGVGKEEDYNARDISIRLADKIEEEVRLVPIRGDIQDLVTNPVYPELYIVNTNADKIRIFDFDQQELTGMLILGGSPSTFNVTPDGKKIYAPLNARNAVIVIDVITRTVIARHELPGAAPHYIAFSPEVNIPEFIKQMDSKPIENAPGLLVSQSQSGSNTVGRIAAISDREESRIFFIDDANNKIIGYKPFPPAYATATMTEMMAFSSDAKYLYVISGRQNDVITFDIRTMQMVQNYTLPKRPDALHVIWGSSKREKPV